MEEILNYYVEFVECALLQSSPIFKVKGEVTINASHVTKVNANVDYPEGVTDIKVLGIECPIHVMSPYKVTMKRLANEK